jgi:tetratricopeptide (TPR) repeat protein
MNGAAMKSVNLSDHADVYSKLRARVEERLGDLRSDAVYSRRKVFEFVDSYSNSFESDAIDLSESQLRYLIDNRLIDVHMDQHSGDYRFRGKDIVEIIVIQTLRQHAIIDGKRRTLLQVKAMRENNGHVTSPQMKRFYDEDVPSTQLSRGYKYFCSRIMGLILTLLVPEKLMNPNLLFIRRTERNSARVMDRSMEIRFLDRVAVDDLVGDFQKGDLIGDMKPDGEIFMPDPVNWLYSSLVRRGIRNWYYMEFNTEEDLDKPVRYLIALGAPEVEEAERMFHEPGNIDDRRLLGLLLKTCFVNLGEESANPGGKMNEPDLAHFVTPLHVILSVIPKLSKYWNYSAAYISASEFSDQLKLLAASSGFPPDLMINGAGLEKGQLLAGWVFKNRKMMVIQETIPAEDPRLRVDPTATAALAVPTWIHDKEQNGVLYVASRHKVSQEELPFPPYTHKYFYLLGGVLGEYIEREYIRLGGIQGAQKVIVNHNSMSRDWGLLTGEIESALQTIQSMQGERVSQLDNLHLVVLRLDNYQQIYDRSMLIARWLMEQATQIIDEYYLERQLGIPLAFPYKEMNRVFFIPRVTISDEDDRDFRYGMRDLLNSIPLQFSHVETVYPKFYVWSIPYRYTTLHNRLSDLSCSSVAIEIVEVIERKINTLKYVEDAHEHERRRAYALAYQAMRRALDQAPNDEYIMRHLTKYLYYQQDYDRALVWAKRVAGANPQPSHLRRLATIQMCNTDVDGAVQSLKRALEINKDDKKCTFMLGLVYFAAGRYEEAIKQFRKTERMDQQEDNTLLRFLAQTYFKLDDDEEAETIVAGLDARAQDDPDVLWLRWQIEPTVEVGRPKRQPGGDHAKP